ncbi:MAG: TatD family hydrolase [Candidatus Pacebacteria bacterium]|jgi:TatD DNase family protein|nr:TatD family hydrolase [Candidatus Paceibacterota bacterium]
MNFKHIDIHSHLNLSQFDTDREEVIAKMKEEGVGTITVGTDYSTSVFAVELAEKHDNLFACIGIHPTDFVTETFEYEKMHTLAVHPRVVAIGECGLDYYREPTEEDRVRQKALFEAHIKLAQEVGKPLMIHARPRKGSMDAYEEVLDILEESKKTYPNLKANFHFFVGDMAIAKRVLALGCTMSFDGPITFARDYDEVIRMLPLESIMVETDAPFASPLPYRGKRCEPWMVSEIVKKIAEIKEMPVDEVASVLRSNAIKMFQLK